MSIIMHKLKKTYLAQQKYSLLRQQQDAGLGSWLGWAGQLAVLGWADLGWPGSWLSWAGQLTLLGSWAELSSWAGL